jgi:hypothetical protein
MPSWQQDIPLSSDANARIGIGWANRNATSAVANHRAVRESITLSIRPSEAKASVVRDPDSSLGMDGYVPKPINSRDFVRCHRERVRSQPRELKPRTL